MLGKRSRPATLLRSSEPEKPRESTTPVEVQARSPNRWRSRDGEGVGLGIVAALERSGEAHGKFVVGSLSLRRSDPIPIAEPSPRFSAAFAAPEAGCSESYTVVTCRGPQSAVTRVYFGETEVRDRRGGEFSRKTAVFWVSPPRFTEDCAGFPASDFLSCCYLCRKKLHGKDIYMYRGEKAFCSTECRYRQIVSDEYKETWRSEVPDIPVPTYSENRLFSPGIVAA